VERNLFDAMAMHAISRTHNIINITDQWELYRKALRKISAPEERVVADANDRRVCLLERLVQLHEAAHRSGTPTLFMYFVTAHLRRSRIEPEKELAPFVVGESDVGECVCRHLLELWCMLADLESMGMRFRRGCIFVVLV